MYFHVDEGEFFPLASIRSTVHLCSVYASVEAASGFRVAGAVAALNDAVDERIPIAIDGDGDHFLYVATFFALHPTSFSGC